MIRLNLVPPEKKKQIGLLQRYLLVKDLIIFLMLIISVIAIVILVAKLIIFNYFTDVVNQTSLTNMYVKIFDTDVKKFNQNLDAVFEVRKNFVTWSDFLLDLNDLTPDDIAIESLNINGNRLLLTGIARSRDDLLAFQNNLNQYPSLKNIEVPLENLLIRENIKYSIKAEIITDNLSE